MMCFLLWFVSAKSQRQVSQTRLKIRKTFCFLSAKNTSKCN